jgi:thymidylate synthase
MDYEKYKKHSNQSNLFNVESTFSRYILRFTIQHCFLWLLLEIIAKEVNMVPDQLIGNLGDVHLYSNHIEQAKEQIQRTSFDLPQLSYLDEYHYLTDKEMMGEISFVDKIAKFRPDFFKVDNYEAHPAIKAPLSN